MVYTNFDEIVNKVKAGHPRKIAVAGAHDDHSVEAALHAAKNGIAQPVLIGNEGKIREVLSSLGHNGDGCEIVDCGAENPAQRAVELVRDGRADFIMKGAIESKDLLKPLVNKENAMGTGRAMSSFALCQIPNYPKLVVSVDGGMIIAPDLELKRQIIVNSVETLRAIGYEEPKVAVLCGVEKVNEKMPETVDAAALKQMNREGKIPDCIVEGPISYDLAISKEAARQKGFDCPWCGEFDILLCPNLASGNILTKAWAMTAGGKWAGLIVGAKIPVVMTSRSSTAEEKYLSIALAALVSGKTE